MNNTKMAVQMGVLALFIGSTGLANAATENGSATATVVTPVTVTQSQELNFGQFAAGDTAGTVVISTAGAHSQTGGVVLMSGSTGQQAGQFDITGEGDNAISVTVGSTATLSDGTNTMAVTIDATPPTQLTSGSATLNVGGTLSVDANQPAGTYNTANASGSTYTVTVNYQ